MEKVVCNISNKTVKEDAAHKGESLRTSLFDLIKLEHPGFTNESYISDEELNKYRNKQLSGLLSDENGEPD